jgi:hypothetical protein
MSVRGDVPGGGGPHEDSEGRFRREVKDFSPSPEKIKRLAREDEETMPLEGLAPGALGVEPRQHAAGAKQPVISATGALPRLGPAHAPSHAEHVRRAGNPLCCATREGHEQTPKPVSHPVTSSGKRSP